MRRRRSQRLPARSRARACSKFHSLRPETILRKRAGRRDAVASRRPHREHTRRRRRCGSSITASLPSDAISPPTKMTPSYIESASASPALPQMTMRALLHHEAGHVAGVAADQQQCRPSSRPRPAPRSRRGRRPCRRGSRRPRRCRRCRRTMTVPDSMPSARPQPALPSDLDRRAVVHAARSSSRRCPRSRRARAEQRDAEVVAGARVADDDRRRLGEGGADRRG